MSPLEIQQMQSRIEFNSIAAQQQAAFNTQCAQGLAGLGQSSLLGCFGVSQAHRYTHKTSIEYELQNDLDAYLKDWKGE